MPTAEARVPTERANRYLVQLCRHASKMTGMSQRPGGGHARAGRHGGAGEKPPRVRHVDRTDTDGVVRFADGRWTLRATPDSLWLRVDADDEDALRRLQDGIAGRIERIGRRDQLTVTWQRGLDTSAVTSVEPAEPGNAAAGAVAGGRAVRGRTRATVIGLSVVGVAVVAAHVGLGGVLVATPWLSWGANAVLAIVVVKLVLMVTGHAVLGGLGIRGIRRRWSARRGSEAAGSKPR